MVDQVAFQNLCDVCRWLAQQVAPSITCLTGTLDTSGDISVLLNGAVDGAIGEYESCTQNFCTTISVSPVRRCMQLQLQALQDHLSSCEKLHELLRPVLKQHNLQQTVHFQSHMCDILQSRFATALCFNSYLARPQHPRCRCALDLQA